MSKKPKCYLWIVFMLLLAACSPGATTNKPTEADISAISTQAVMTVEVQMTQTAAIVPTATIIPTVLPTEILAVPSPTSLPLFPLNGYVMLFTKDGDLYFQDGVDTPSKLAHIPGKSYPSPPYIFRLSDDEQKVVFYQNDGNIYSINTDGTHEQIIIPNDWLASLATGALRGVLEFIPKTHILFLEAVTCKEKSSTSLCSTTIFLADTDTGKIRKLADLGLAREPGISENIQFSPNGKMVAIGTTDSIKIFTLDGKSIRKNILPYTPIQSNVLFPSLFWLPDSSGLIVAIPDKSRNDPFFVDGTAAYTIWRYTIDSNTTVQIPFDPPAAGALSVSPDGNWIVYGSISPVATELYLGNLADGSTKTFGNDLHKNFSWSPDSKHFIHGQAVVLSFDKPFVYGGAGPGWVDSNHFLYYDIPANNPAIQQERILMAEIRDDEVYYYELRIPYPGLVSIKPKQ